MGLISHPVMKYLFRSSWQDTINVMDQHDVLGDSKMIKSVPGDLITIICQRIEGIVPGASF